MRSGFAVIVRNCEADGAVAPPASARLNRGKTAARISGAMASPRARSFWDDG